MGRHDYRSHKLHVTKQQKFRITRPGGVEQNEIQRAPQAPRQGTSAQNQFK